MRKALLFVLLCLVLFLPGAVFAAEVVNLKLSMEGNLGRLDYDLIGGLGEREAEVTVAVEIQGVRYTADKLSLRGDFGSRVKVGRSKRIYWDILKDYPAGFDDDVIWDVTAGGPPVQAAKKQAPANENIFTSATLNAKFVLLPAGTFMMGSPSDEPGRDSDETQHRVTLTRPFYLQTTEVTQGQWKAVMGNNPSNFSNCGDNCPVQQVSWNDVQEFIRKLNQRESTNKYRLPTEAEWEYAARAVTTTPFHTGSCLSTDQANYDGNYPQSGCSKGEYRQKTISVASFSPNAWGLYDMSGNVWEWVQDWKGDYPSSSVTDPQGPSGGSDRVRRGGGWGSGAGGCRAAGRDGNTPGGRRYGLGFRLARTH